MTLGLAVVLSAEVRNSMEQMKQDIIPRVWQMAEKEKEHLKWLIDNNAPKEMIEKSQRYLSHFRQRHKEYIEYAEGLS